MRHFNIPVFVPHLGCPHDCAFCNQKRITGADTRVTAKDVADIIETHLATIEGGFVEAAFFGGSFTGIAPQKQEELLSAAYKYVKSGRLGGIRVSTRPDYIDRGRLELLKKYGVTAVELGVQSMDDGVLSMNNRGHTSADVERASGLIRQFGFELGHQMMTGLYGSTPEKDVFTARAIIGIRPDTIRIYPTIVLRGTALERYFLKGIYTPPALDQTVALCKTLVGMFERAGIRVIRLGLQATDTIREDGDIVAGPYHSAFGQLVESAIMRDIMEKKLSCYADAAEAVTIEVSPAKLSAAVGDKRTNIEYIKQRFGLKKVKIKAGKGLDGREISLIWQ